VLSFFVRKAKMFRTLEEEVKELVKELRELKDVLHEVSTRLGHIEARAKRAFPAAFPKASSALKPPASKLTDPPTISPEEALKLYDELVILAKEGDKGKVQRRLEELGLPDLSLLSRELGVALGKSKPSRKVLINGVLGRINESIMLSTSSLRRQLEQQDGGGDTSGSSVEQTDKPSSTLSPESPRIDSVG
jgi:hypothetical protein